MTVPDRSRITRFLSAEADTLALGAELARGVMPGLVVYLIGDLGTGKTTVVRGLLRACGYTQPVKSPTFSLVELYNLSKLYLYHFDFYRFRHPEEWADTGLREYFNAESTCFVEWPDKVGSRLPAADVRIELEVSGAGRSATLSAESEAGKKCLTRLQVCSSLT